MKIKIIPWIIITILLITQFYGYEFFQLNQQAISITHSLFVSGPLSLDDSSGIKFFNSSLDCHENWLHFIKIVSTKKGSILPESSELMACSKIYMRMLRKLYPNNFELAELAVQLNPDETLPLYWLIQSTDPSISIVSKPVILKILSMNPKDGLAWRYLGIILIREGDIPAAIEAHIKSCNNGDPGSNGCYVAGRLYEQEGNYEQAIYYYRLSRNESYRANADRLEAELSTQNP